MHAAELRRAILAALSEDQRAQLPADQVDAATARLSEHMVEIGLEDGRAAALAAHVAGKLDAAPFPQLHLRDLTLAFAASHGNDAAAREIRAMLDAVDGALRKLGCSQADLDDVKQSVVASVLVPRPGRRAEILDYAARGPLGGWLRVMCLRQAMRALEKGRRASTLEEDDFAEHLTTSDDVVSRIAKETTRGALSAALRRAIGDLPPVQKNVLRYQILDGLGVTELGVIYGVHRATAARWAAEARAALLTALQARLAEEVRLDPGELESLVRLVGSQIDISLARLLEQSE